jgi:hypothetical protein
MLRSEIPSTGAMVDVGHWLQRLGLEEYEPAFRKNRIDGEVLPTLTAEDLETLGVKFVGHRRKLLDAVTALRDAAATSQLSSLQRECKQEQDSCALLGTALYIWQRHVCRRRSAILVITVLVGGLGVLEVLIRLGEPWADFLGGLLLLATGGMIAWYATVARAPDLTDVERSAG